MADEVYDLCIIGAGMYGSAAARHASAHSAVKVCLIGPTEPKEDERASRDILSSYYDEGRIVHVAYASPVMQVLVRHTIERFRHIEKLSGIPFFSPVGCIVTAERGTSHFHQLLQEFEMHDVNYLDLSEGDIMKLRFPYLKLDDRDCPLFDDDGAGYIRSRAMVEAQKKIAQSQGCHIVEDIVEEVKDFKDGAHEIIMAKGHVLKAKKVLFCTGAFTEFKKFDPLKKLKIQVNRETAAMLRISEEEKDRLSSMPTLMMYRDGLADMPAAAKGAYILPPIQYPDGHWYLKIGHMGTQRNPEVGTLEEIREWYNGEGDQEVLDKYSRFLIGIIPVTQLPAWTRMICVSSELGCLGRRPPDTPPPTPASKCVSLVLMNQRFPFLRLEGCFHPFLDTSGAGHISPRSLVEAQKKVAEMQGCRLVDEVVRAVGESASGMHEVLTESGRIINAKRVLFCPGAFTNFKKLGPAQKLKITVHKETAALLEISDDERARLSSMPAIIMYKKEIGGMPPSTTGTYILPPIRYPDGKCYLKIGPMGHQRNSEITTLQEAKGWYSEPGDPEVMQKMTRLISKIIPNLQVAAVRSKTCITCDSPPHLPYIDRLTPTVTVAVVGNGLGATTCDEVGRIAAELSVTGKWDSELPKSLFEAIYER